MSEGRGGHTQRHNNDRPTPSLPLLSFLSSYFPCASDTVFPMCVSSPQLSFLMNSLSVAGVCKFPFSLRFEDKRNGNLFCFLTSHLSASLFVPLVCAISRILAEHPIVLLCLLFV